MIDPTIIVEAITTLIAVVIALKYRSLYKKKKQLCEEIFKPKNKPATRPHTSPQAIQAQTELQEYLEIRSKILLRDHFRCQECGYFKHLEVHHIIPRSKGGSDDLTNLVTLCQRCHAKKHGHGYRENRRRKHTRRNNRKKFRRYVNKHHDEIRKASFQVTTIEDVHPHQENLSAEARIRRQRLYDKWKHNELNQLTKKEDCHT